jgi:hypothetical protein
MSTPEQHLEGARKFQTYYDDVLRTVGMRAPAPVLGDTVKRYRIKTLVKAKKAFIPADHELRQFSLNDIKADAFEEIEKQILKAVVTEANNPQNVPVGELRKLETLDDYGQVKTIKFIGQDAFFNLRNHGVSGGNLNFPGGARPGRRMRFFNEKTHEWYPPKR